MSGQYGKGTVHLLSQYDASQLMWQSHATKRKKHVGTLARRRRPPIRGSNGEHQTLDSLVADTAEPRSELIRGVLLAATIQQNRVRGSATGLPIQPVEDRRLRIEQLRLARNVSCGTLYIVSDPAVAGLGFRAGAAWRDGSKSDLHPHTISSVS
jgi:hypothetical protein